MIEENPINKELLADVLKGMFYEILKNEPLNVVVLNALEVLEISFSTEEKVLKQISLLLAKVSDEEIREVFQQESSSPVLTAISSPIKNTALEISGIAFFLRESVPFGENAEDWVGGRMDMLINSFSRISPSNLQKYLSEDIGLIVADIKNKFPGMKEKTIQTKVQDLYEAFYLREEFLEKKDSLSSKISIVDQLAERKTQEAYAVLVDILDYELKTNKDSLVEGITNILDNFQLPMVHVRLEQRAKEVFSRGYNRVSSQDLKNKLWQMSGAGFNKAVASSATSSALDQRVTNL